MYLNAVHFITPCTPYPTEQLFMGKIPLITYCIASREIFQDKAVKTLDCRGEKKKIDIQLLSQPLPSYGQIKTDQFRG